MQCTSSFYKLMLGSLPGSLLLCELGEAAVWKAEPHSKWLQAAEGDACPCDLACFFQTLNTLCVGYLSSPLRARCLSAQPRCTVQPNSSSQLPAGFLHVVSGQRQCWEPGIWLISYYLSELFLLWKALCYRDLTMYCHSLPAFSNLHPLLGKEKH